MNHIKNVHFSNKTSSCYFELFVQTSPIRWDPFAPINDTNNILDRLLSLWMHRITSAAFSWRSYFVWQKKEGGKKTIQYAADLFGAHTPREIQFDGWLHCELCESQYLESILLNSRYSRLSSNNAEFVMS